MAAVDCSRPLIPPNQLSPDAFPESWAGRRRQPPSYVRPNGRWVLDAFGLHQQDGEDELISHRVAIFRQGVFEWARRYRFDPGLPCRTFAEDAHDVLGYAATVFADVGYLGRLATFVRIENAEEAVPEIQAGWDLAVRPAGVESMGHFREASVDELQLDPTPAVREAMDVIWQGFGVRSCPYFDENGDWANV